MSGYIGRLIAAYALGQLDPVGAYSVAVAHDPGCALRAGTGDCNCDPDVTVHDLRTDRLAEIGPDGRIGAWRVTA